MEKDYIVLQVRLRSQRLPEKLLLPLKGITIFEHILKRLSGARLPEGIIVATTEDTKPRIKDIMEVRMMFCHGLPALLIISMQAML